MPRGALGAGDDPEQVHRHHPIEVTEVVAPSKLVIKSTDSKGDVFMNTYTVTPSGNGTQIERTLDIHDVRSYTIGYG